MNNSEEKDRVVAIPVPDPDVDNPLPIVLSKDGTVVLSYVAFVANKDAHIMMTFHYAFGHRFGPPDRKGLASHPLAARGLKRDGVFEVLGSSWIRDSFGGKGRHYVLTFKDVLFECAAEGYGTEKIDENDDVVRLMSRRLYK